MSKLRNHTCKTLPNLVRRLSRNKADQHGNRAQSGVDGRGSAHGFERILSPQSGQALIKVTLMVAILGGAFGLAIRTVPAQTVEPPVPPDVPVFASLKSIPVPGPSAADLAEYMVNTPQAKKAAIQLGKALFWDTKVGSDNNTACASCHFHAGADHRTTNTLNPAQLAGDSTFQLGGPNYMLKPANFPFTKHVSEADPSSPRLSDINDVVGSQGVFSATFTDIGGSFGAADKCADVPDPIFHGGSGFYASNTRQVTGRNTPTAINAVFNFRNFWDGRANNMFNGGDPFGKRNPNALVWKLVNGTPMQVKVAIPISSLASQADGPPLSSVEMSCAGRSFMKLGKKLLSQAPLSRQTIAPNDSVLSTLLGVSTTYGALIEKAFQPAYWAATTPISTSGADALKVAPMDLYGPRPFNRDLSSFQVSQKEANFALFFGLAVQMYEATLVANDTPFDRYLDGNTNALNAQQKAGFEVFKGAGRCAACHDEPTMNHTSVAYVLDERIEKMIMGDGQEAVYDSGFYNIGVRPTAEDLGVGGTDPFGNPLSETRMVQKGLSHLLGDFDTSKQPTVGPYQRVAVDGAFKTPGLRNVEFTGPYFHNGGKATLMQVVDFYDRGGDFGSENHGNLDADISKIGLTVQQKIDLVAFLLALSDDRVRYQKAPFDHPSICVPNGHPVYLDGSLVKVPTTGHAADNMQCLPAIGAYGLVGDAGKLIGLETFLKLSPFQR